MSKNKIRKGKTYMKKWEYQTVIGALSTNDLNNLGKNGWELCAGVSGVLYKTKFIFKRPLEEEINTEE